MKHFIFAILLFPMVAFGAVNRESALSGPETYTCEGYTDNVVDTVEGSNEIITDNPIQWERTVVLRTTRGYVIKANSLFKEDQILMVEPLITKKADYADNDTIMLFKKFNGVGTPYFLLFVTDDPTVSSEEEDENPIVRIVTIAPCRVN